MFKVEYFLNGSVKKDGVNANLILCNWPNFKYLIDFTFSSRLSLNTTVYNTGQLVEQ